MDTCSQNLVLDAGPLLALSPLRGLAETFYTVPQVLDELKDKRAREHFERLGLSAGVKIQVQNPDSKSLAHGMLYICLVPSANSSFNTSHPVCEENGRLLSPLNGRFVCARSNVLSGAVDKGERQLKWR